MRDDVALIDRVAMLFYGLAAAAFAFLALNWLAQRPAMAVRVVEVTTPLVEVDSGLLEAVIRSDVRGSFFTLSLERVRDALRKLPWVREARVSRHWPSTLRIAIEEHTAVAQWSENELLAADGTVFRATARARLPRFEAQHANPAEALARYEEARRALAALGMHITRFGMSDRGAVWVEADARLRVDFGREQFRERLERFTQTLSRWSEAERAQLIRVDLRYRSALSVARQPLAQGRAEEKGEGR
ncbi:MAG: cell division protein FtsQ/DivIB [Casimicrobiaceae bacterium]